MLQKKFPKLSTQTFTDHETRIHKVITLRHQDSHVLQDASPRVLLVRQQDLRRRGSWINRGFYCCWGSRCLQYKATVIFRVLRNQLNRYSGLRKERCSGSSAGLAWPHHAPKAKGHGHAFWEPSCRLTGTETQQTWLKSLSSKQLEILQLTQMLLKQQRIKIIFKIVKKSILTFSL